jgi:hypothetical protein
MAFVQVEYDDNRFFNEIKKLHPEINFGNGAQLVDFEIKPGQKPAVVVRVEIALSREQLRAAIDASRIN